jgi:adenylate kinase
VCGAIYHVVTKPPKAEGICDLCGGELYIRNDDKEETVKARLNAYHEETEPLIGWYGNRSLLLTIDGSPDAETVYNAFISEIGRFLRK